jgi:hypothetical protein
LADLLGRCLSAPFQPAPPSRMRPRAAARCTPYHAVLDHWPLPQPRANTPADKRIRTSLTQPAPPRASPTHAGPACHARPVAAAVVLTTRHAPSRARPPLLSPGGTHLYKPPMYLLSTLSPPSPFVGKVAAVMLCFSAAAVHRGQLGSPPPLLFEQVVKHHHTEGQPSDPPHRCFLHRHRRSTEPCAAEPPHSVRSLIGLNSFPFMCCGEVLTSPRSYRGTPDRPLSFPPAAVTTPLATAGECRPFRCHAQSLRDGPPLVAGLVR